MSKFDDRVQVITDFLDNRAKLGRLTTFHEVGVVAGRKLYEQGKRNHSTPLSRDKVATALAQIAKNSYAKDGLVLPALVVHFWDNNPGHRWKEWCDPLIYKGDTNPFAHAITINHTEALSAIFNTYGSALVTFKLSPTPKKKPPFPGDGKYPLTPGDEKYLCDDITKETQGFKDEEEDVPQLTVNLPDSLQYLNQNPQGF